MTVGCNRGSSLEKSKITMKYRVAYFAAFALRKLAIRLQSIVKHTIFEVRSRVKHVAMNLSRKQQCPQIFHKQHPLFGPQKTSELYLHVFGIDSGLMATLLRRGLQNCELVS